MTPSDRGAVDDAPDPSVRISIQPVRETGCDVRIDIDVGATPRAEIAAAIEGPLTRAVAEHARALRFRRVAVSVRGDAMIPTKVKHLVEQLLPPCRPRSVALQRGYAEEAVFEGDLPEVAVSCRVNGNAVRFEATTTGLEPEDLPALLAPALAELCGKVRGKQVVCRFTGPAPDPVLLRDALFDAGAKRLEVDAGQGPQVLLDREVEGLVRVTPGATRDKHTRIDLQNGDAGQVAQALRTVLPQHREAIHGRRVLVRPDRVSARPEEIAVLAEVARELQPESLSMIDGDVVWPPLLKVARGAEAWTVRAELNGRPDLQPAFGREVAALGIAGQHVVFDWPADVEVSTDLVEQLLAQRPKSLVFTVDGAAREPVFPPLIRAELHDGVWRCTIDTGRAAPDELDRALSRALPQLDVAGAKVDVVARPEPIPLRTQQLLAERLAALHAARVRVLDDVGVVYLLPRLFRFASLESGEVEVSVAAADRDTEQLARDAALELRGAPFGPGTTVRLVGSDDPALVRALAAHGVRRVTLAGDPPVQLHPRLFREVQCEGEERTVSAAPEADDRTVLTQVDYELPGVMERLGDVSGVAIDLVWSTADPTDRARARVVDRLIAAGPAKVRLVDGRGRRKQIFPEVIRRHVEVLGRRTTSALPMLLLGVDTEEADEVMAKLDAMADQLRGQRILLVFRDDALREVALPADHPLQCAVLERLGEIATAVLVFRPEVVIPACFEVVATRQDDLPLGQRLRDPRR